MKSILLLSLITASAACVDPLDDTEDTTTTDTPRLAVNGMLPGQMQYTNLDAAPLTSTAIYNLATFADGRAYLNYVVGCALTGAQSITANGYTFTGSVGLVPDWTTRSITLGERQWVSACVIARTNYIGTSQQVSLRGPNPALALSGAELTGYNLEEGAYYGDIFGGMSFRRVCADPATFDSSLLGYKGRRCTYDNDQGTNTSLCGFALDGECSAHCTKVDGVYTSCTDINGATWTAIVKVQDL